MNQYMISEAYSHTIKELQLDNIKESLNISYNKAQKCHDSIHEYMMLASKLFPSKGVSWHTKSAFILYHWETFDLAHRSYTEALCGYYNVAFILLRSVLELIIKGAFFECLAHREYRDNTEILEKDRNGEQLVNIIKNAIKDRLEIANQLEETSATIHDMIMVVIEDPTYRPSIQTLIKQLFVWGIFKPIKDWEMEIWDTYKKLSADVHVIPDRIDIGQVLLLNPEDLFKSKKVYKERLDEYLRYLHNVMDIGITIELNILKDNIKYDIVRANLIKRQSYLKELGLSLSLNRVKSFTNE